MADDTSAEAEQARMLRRILAVVEKDRESRWVQVMCAIILALATTASAWCAYQATLWGAVETFELHAAGQADRRASRLAIEAVEFRIFDTLLLSHYLDAHRTNDAQRTALIYQRFRPEMKQAVDAWLQTDPFNSTGAPRSPFDMPQYVLQQRVESDQQEEQSRTHLGAAHRADDLAATYVLLTVLFAAVLFFGGITSTFESRRVRMVLGLTALLLFLVTTGFLASMPTAEG